MSMTTFSKGDAHDNLYLDKSLNEEELERKIKEDIENLEIDENESMLNFDRGSIFFDVYIQKQNDRIKQDQEEYEKENRNLKEYLKNNRGGQEIFDEMDRELANAKKLIKVKVKKDPNPEKNKARSKVGSKQQQRDVSKKKNDFEGEKGVDDFNMNMSGANNLDIQNMSISNQSNHHQNNVSDNQIKTVYPDQDDEQSQQNDDQTEYLEDDESENQSFVEIVDMFGEKIKCKPDIITESQYVEMKQKAKLEAQQRAREFVFAEDKIKRQFMEQEGLLSDEDSIMSEEFMEELKDELRMTHGNMLRNADERIEQMKRSQIDNLSLHHNSSLGALPKTASLTGLLKNPSASNIIKNSKIENNINNSNMNNNVNGNNSYKKLETSPDVKRKQTSSKRNLLQNSIEKNNSFMERGSASKNYDLIMSGQKQLRSSVTESILFKQQLEQKLEEKQDKINQEREAFDMENEDLLSLEYEEYLQKKQFSAKDYKLPPSFPFYTENPTPTFQDIYFDENAIRMLNINFDEPLDLNDEGNILGRDSQQVSLEDAVKVSNRRSLAGKINFQPVSKVTSTTATNNLNSNNSSQPDYSHKASNNLTVRSTNQPQNKSNSVAYSQKSLNSDIQNQQSNEIIQSNGISKIIKLCKEGQKQFVKIEGEEGKIISLAQKNIIKLTKIEDSSNILQQQGNRFDSVVDIYHNKMIQNHSILLSKYEKASIFKDLNNIFTAHQPKLIRQFFDVETENIFLDDENQFEESVSSSIVQKNDQGGEQKKSLDSFLQNDIFQNFEKKKRLELKLEKLGDIEGLKKLPNLEILSLAVNRIEKLDKLNQLNGSKIIELNLAQNQISDYSQIKNLKELRYLNLELNRIKTMADLSNCKHLEVLNLNTNQIQKIENLSSNKQLRKLYLFRNKIQRIQDSLKHNLFLEELDLGRNALESIDGLQNNVLLKKLVVYYNELTEIPKDFSFIFLVELYLNGNKLKDINGLQYLPCLEYLQLGHNQIEKISALPLMPNLTTLITSFNKIWNFESVLNLVRASPNIKYIGFNDNEFVKRNISEDLRELYEFLFLRILPGLLEVNHQGVDIGRKKYLEMRFNSILKQKKSINSDSIQSFLNEFAIITRQHSFLQTQKKNRQTNLFAQNIDFYKIDSSFTFNHLISMYNISQLSQSKSNSTSSKIISSSNSTTPSTALDSNLINTTNSSLKNINILYNSIFFQKDIFENKYIKSIHKIKTLALKTLYQIKKKKQFYNKNLQYIIKIQKNYKGYSLRKVINFRKIFDERSKHRYAIKIQKVYRGYRLRKKIKQRLAKVKYQDDEELPEFDDAWLNQEIDDYDTGLKIPENFDVMSFINPPKTQIPIQQQKIIQQPQNNSSNTITSIGGISNQQKIGTKVNSLSSQAQKNTILPPLQQKPLSQPLIQNNNFMGNGQQQLPTLQNQKPPSPLIKKKIHPKSIADNTGFFNTQKARLNVRQENNANSDYDAMSHKEDNFSQSGTSMKSENHARKNAQSMMSPMSSSSSSSLNANGFQSQGKRLSSGASKVLNPIKSVKVTEEEKQKIMQEHGFTQPELVQTFAYRIERMRKNKIKQQPLTAEQRYEKFVKASKK